MTNYFANLAGQPQHAPQTTHPLTVKDSEPLRKENKQLTKFDGNMMHYKVGRTHDRSSRQRVEGVP